MSDERFQVLIIGSGPAGFAAAEAAYAAGARSIAVAEASGTLGGECPNWGCLPTKSLLSSVEALIKARQDGEVGLLCPKPGVDFGSLMRRERDIVKSVTGGQRLEKELAGMGVRLLPGHAKFVAPDAVEIAGVRYEADHFVIASGSVNVVPPIPGLVEAGYLDVPGILKLEKSPRSLAIIGGGPVGVEFAQIFAPLGTAVTIIEAASHILPREDEEIASVIENSFRDQGATVLTSAKVLSVYREGEERVVEVSDASGEVINLRVEHILLAAGKRPLLDQLNLDAAGVALDDRGHLVLNEYLQTTNSRVYAAGDAAGRMMYTSVAHREGQAAAMNAVKGNSVIVNLSVMPRGTYCHPEVGSVGLTEAEARAAHFDVAVGRAPYAALSKSLTSGDQQGLIKIVADKGTGEILGGHIVGQSAAELVHEIALAMYAGLTVSDLANMIHAFPTYAEGIALAASNVS
ncbi:MAG: NAD(P)/FAD-dependent oxidoreductase [Patescibacteria group bacterium]|nr:NAD(P)/FAD-dependent oxidoreductase [Patescibacteria group bacterium]